MSELNLSLAFNLPPEKAIKYLKEKDIKINFDWEAAEKEARAKAFSLANTFKTEILTTTLELLKSSTESGQTIEEFKKNFRTEMLNKGLYSDTSKEFPNSRLENIFRTNTQSAYMAGHYKDLVESKKFLPYWRYVSVVDDRTTDICTGLNDKVFPADHPFWNDYFPPNHFHCRATVEPLSEDDGKDLVIDDDEINKSKELFPLKDGFDHNPGLSMLYDSPEATLVDDNLSAEDLGRNEIEPDELLPDPEALSPSDDILEVFSKAFNFDKDNVSFIESPIENIPITLDSLTHLIKNKDSEKYANHISKTLKDPYEVYLTKYDDEKYRKQYIGVYKSSNVVVRINQDNSLSFIKADKKINNYRKGVAVLYSRKTKKNG